MVLIDLISFVDSSSMSLSGRIYHQLLQLPGDKRNLCNVPAHPDDVKYPIDSPIWSMASTVEGLFEHYSRRGVRNLIGKELGIGLGQMSSQELLKARENGWRKKQFFTVRLDFDIPKDSDQKHFKTGKEKSIK